MCFTTFVIGHTGICTPPCAPGRAELVAIYLVQEACNLGLEVLRPGFVTWPSYSRFSVYSFIIFGIEHPNWGAPELSLVVQAWPGKQLKHLVIWQRFVLKRQCGNHLWLPWGVWECYLWNLTTGFECNTALVYHRGRVQDHFCFQCKGENSFPMTSPELFDISQPRPQTWWSDDPSPNLQTTANRDETSYSWESPAQSTD